MRNAIVNAIYKGATRHKRHKSTGTSEAVASLNIYNSYYHNKYIYIYIYLYY